MLLFSFVIVVVQCLVATLAITTKQSVISTATQNNLNQLLQNMYNKAQAIITLTGLEVNVPLADPLIPTNTVNQTGTSQQAIYGNYIAIPYGRDAYFSLANGAFQIYLINGQYSWVKSNTVSCSKSVQTGVVSAPCRQIYHWGQLGVTVDGGEPVKSQANYNAAARPWYTQAVTRGKLGWSTVFTFSTPNGVTQVTGVTLSGPWYSGTTVIGVVAVDVDYTFLTPIVQKYQENGNYVYLVETSSNSLVATSTGENPVTSSGTVLTCTQATNPVVSESCAFLQSSQFGSTWAPDGQYQATLGGESYVIDLVSYTDPQTETLAWKLIVVGEGTLPTTNYVTPSYNAAYYTLTDIQARMAMVQSGTEWLLFLSGAHNQAPLTNNLISRTSPMITGNTQQAIWSAFNSYKSVGQALYCFAVGYQYNSTYLGYTYNPDGTFYYQYRPSNPDSGCKATDGLPGYPAYCLQKYYPNANGTPGAVFAQVEFNTTQRPWYKATETTGGPTWSPLFTSALSTTTLYLISFATPLWDPVTGIFAGNAVVSYQFNYDITPILERYGGSNTVYLVDISDGYLMANNVGAPIYSSSTASYILATASTNNVIKSSANYLSVNGYSADNFEVTTLYNSTTNMHIVANYWLDSSQTFSGYLVYVTLEPAVVTSPTTAPTGMYSSSSSSSNDDTVTQAKNASIAASVLAAILIILVIALIVIFFQANKRQPQPSAPSAIVMSPLGGSKEQA